MVVVVATAATKASVERFWKRHVKRGGEKPDSRAVSSEFEIRLPAAFSSLLRVGEVQRVDAPDFHVAEVGDWLEHAWERHVVMRGLADAMANPRLAEMVPFGDTEHGFEVALEISTGRVVWLDPERFDSGDDAIVSVVGESVEAWLESIERGELGTIL